MTASGLALEIDAERVLRDLDELRLLTGSEAGADRLAWTDGWLKARSFLAQRMSAIGLDPDQDEAGNTWYEVRGDGPEVVVVGSHLDSVPNGGWLDGVFGVMTGAAVLEAYSRRPGKVTLRLADWADEEGARFGRSCFGSACAASALDTDAVANLTDADGNVLTAVLQEHGIRLEDAGKASARLDDVSAYLELHIEQGPVLEQRGESVAVVIGTFGVERHEYTFRGRSSHAGSTPMDSRRDAFLGAARLALKIRATAIDHGAVGTTGVVQVSPSLPTIINSEARVVVDMRALAAEDLANMLEAVDAESLTVAEEESLETSRQEILRIPPVIFDYGLRELASRACTEAAGSAHELPSGALHDASEVGRRVPTVMLFAPSIAGISHSVDEDTSRADLTVAIEAFGRLVAMTLESRE